MGTGAEGYTPLGKYLLITMDLVELQKFNVSGKGWCGYIALDRGQGAGGEGADYLERVRITWGFMESLEWMDITGSWLDLIHGILYPICSIVKTGKDLPYEIGLRMFFWIEYIICNNWMLVTVGPFY